MYKSRESEASEVPPSLFTVEKWPGTYLRQLETYARLVRARKFIDDNFEGPLNLEQISGQAFFSPCHFIRLFRSVFGKTPYQYLTQRRIEKAKYYLRETSTPVTQICYMVGFESLGSFSTLFTKTVGMSPSAYRKHDLQLKAAILDAPQLAIPSCFLFMHVSQE